jgi:uncharacterized membrane protein
MVFKMTGVKIELLVEFAVILLAPIIHAYYLWKYKKVEKKDLIKNVKIFGGLYAVLGLVVFILIINN